MFGLPPWVSRSGNPKESLGGVVGCRWVVRDVAVGRGPVGRAPARPLPDVGVGGASAIPSIYRRLETRRSRLVLVRLRLYSAGHLGGRRADTSPRIAPQRPRNRRPRTTTQRSHAVRADVGPLKPWRRFKARLPRDRRRRRAPVVYDEAPSSAPPSSSAPRGQRVEQPDADPGSARAAYAGSETASRSRTAVQMNEFSEDWSSYCPGGGRRR